MPKPVRAVIFDFFGVIAYDQDPATRERIEQVLDVPAPTLWQRYWRYRRAHDLNELDGREFWRAVADTELDAATTARLIELDVASASRVDDSVVDIVRELGEQPVTVSLLSNLPLDTLRWHQEHTPVLAEFADVRASCLTGLAKPDPAAFNSAITRLAVSPEEAVFIDDQEANVTAAAELGLHAVRYHRGMDLRSTLAALMSSSPSESVPTV
ncbi:HAD family hydrolase [Kutzneria albida]|uniref:Uncharacterized protein n=1 Tax=Kutzneria albida DSM 43870 TaxID=1449976 RepID=W5WEB4_9PSEU|nr:HAD family phosphatase [Kutzneria albida]AHH99110.1 hypothetical protein KALB_5749 [Kutzneria albida DSM 43870]